jgi:hypothetical protein
MDVADVIKSANETPHCHSLLHIGDSEFKTLAGWTSATERTGRTASRCMALMRNPTSHFDLEELDAEFEKVAATAYCRLSK